MLYVVATPIGNPGDMSVRAAQLLGSVDLIAAEDTRRCMRLLAHLGISRPVVAYHDHSDERRLQDLLKRLHNGQNLALVSDAGTPLVSDPGYRLVRCAIEAGVQVVAVPGPCAATAALSVAGLPSDRFVFEGFLASRHEARHVRLEALADEARTMIFYESPRRILATLEDMVASFGASRQAVVARELTKVHETLLYGTLAELAQRVGSDPEQQLGEIVLLVHGAPERDATQAAPEVERLLSALLARLPLKDAVQCAVEICNRPRNELYRAALDLRSTGRSGSASDPL